MPITLVFSRISTQLYHLPVNGRMDEESLVLITRLCRQSHGSREVMCYEFFPASGAPPVGHTTTPTMLVSFVKEP